MMRHGSTGLLVWMYICLPRYFPYVVALSNLDRVGLVFRIRFCIIEYVFGLFFILF